MDVQLEGLIQAAGSGTRLGLGPKAFVKLDGETLLERAVRLAKSVVASVIVAVPAVDVERAIALVGGARVRVITGAASRSETTRLLIAEARAPWLLLHDVVHPFVTRDLIDRLLAKAREVGAAAPGIPNTEFLYDRSGELLYGPGDLVIGQKPVAFSRRVALDGYASLPDGKVEADPSLLDILERGGVRTAFVAGSPGNIKITTPADLRFAHALIALDLAESRSGAR